MSDTEQGRVKMSYKQKCLEIDSGLLCFMCIDHIYRPVSEITSHKVVSVYTGETLGSGLSAASAWRDAWERLREVPG